MCNNYAKLMLRIISRGAWKTVVPGGAVALISLIREVKIEVERDVNYK